MSNNDYAGRISKSTFINSIIVLFVVAILGTCLRTFVRLRTHNRSFSIDDAFLYFGVASLITSFGMVFTFVDKIYLVEALQLGAPGGAALPPDFINQAFDFQKWSIICLMVLWMCITAVKFSFLFLFRQLIDRIRPMVLYWYAVVGFCVIAWAFGLAAYIIACPHFYSFDSLQCSQGVGLNKTLAVASVSQALDILGDFFILAIPVRLIWTIQIRWTQRLILAFSLCLSVVMIAVTLIRASGLKSGEAIDVVWEIYWQFLSAEVGIILTAVTAFRSLFLPRDRVGGSSSRGSWLQRSKRFLKETLSLRSWRTKNFSDGSQSIGASGGEAEMLPMPQVPRATMTGVRTFINGKSRYYGSSRIMHSDIEAERTSDEEEQSLFFVR